MHIGEPSQRERSAVEHQFPAQIRVLLLAGRIVADHHGIALAAVFVDGLFAGHVGEFDGMGQGMLVAPGTHQIRIALPGYQTFETEINPLANQKVEIKTDLVKNGPPLSGPLVETETSAATGK